MATMTKKKPAAAATADLPFGVEARDLTAAQRRELFLKTKKATAKDWRVVQPNTKEELIPFNNLTLDHVLRLYGLARNGTVYQIHGEEGSSKSTLGYTILREYQRATDEPVAIMDFERTYKSWYANDIGLNEKMLFVKKPDSVEDSVQIAVGLMKYSGVRVFMFDSIPRMRSMVTEEDIASKAAFKVQPAVHARGIQQFYDIILPYIAKYDGTLIMVNQTRSRIEQTHEAQAAAKGYATVTNLNYSLPGGRANRYAVSAMLEMTIVKAWQPGKHPDEFILEATAKDGAKYVATELKVRTLKNKITGTGYRQGTLWARPGLGLDENISIRQIARELGLIANHGKRWFVGTDVENAIKVYPDKAKAIADLVTDPNADVLEALKTLIIQRLTTDASIGRAEVSEEESRYLEGQEADSQDMADAPTPQPVNDDDI